ncbi:MAG: HAD-IIA family hydrolase [Acidimicrobiales bacterium]|nr:HAD-IIA family hydrolase [Acidimicrobiales bacterium]
MMWLDPEPIAGSAAAIATLQAAGVPVLFVTNSSIKTARQIEAKLAAMDVDATDAVVSSATAVAQLVAPGDRVLVAGGPGIHEALDAAGAEAIADGPDTPTDGFDAIILGIHFDFDYAVMTRLCQAILGGARFLATNDDSSFPTPNGLVPGNGALVASVERATGLTADIAGKPHPAMVSLVRDRVGEHGIMVGDRPDTDGRFAYAMGYEFGLVLSGVTGAAALPVQPEPAFIAADLAELVAKRHG